MLKEEKVMKRIVKKVATFILTLAILGLSTFVAFGATPRLSTEHLSNYNYSYDGYTRVSAKFGSYSTDGGRTPFYGKWMDISTMTGGSFTDQSFEKSGRYIYGLGITKVYDVVRESGRLVTHVYG